MRAFGVKYSSKADFATDLLRYLRASACPLKRQNITNQSIERLVQTTGEDKVIQLSVDNKAYLTGLVHGAECRPFQLAFFPMIGDADKVRLASAGRIRQRQFRHVPEDLTIDFDIAFRMLKTLESDDGELAKVVSDFAKQLPFPFQAGLYRIAVRLGDKYTDALEKKADISYGNLLKEIFKNSTGLKSKLKGTPALEKKRELTIEFIGFLIGLTELSQLHPHQEANQTIIEAIGDILESEQPFNTWGGSDFEGSNLRDALITLGNNIDPESARLLFSKLSERIGRLPYSLDDVNVRDPSSIFALANGQIPDISLKKEEVEFANVIALCDLVKSIAPYIRDSDIATELTIKRGEALHGCLLSDEIEVQNRSVNLGASHFLDRPDYQQTISTSVELASDLLDVADGIIKLHGVQSAEWTEFKPGFVKALGEFSHYLPFVVARRLQDRKQMSDELKATITDNELHGSRINDKANLELYREAKELAEKMICYLNDNFDNNPLIIEGNSQTDSYENGRKLPEQAGKEFYNTPNLISILKNDHYIHFSIFGIRAYREYSQNNRFDANNDFWDTLHNNIVAVARNLETDEVFYSRVGGSYVSLNNEHNNRYKNEPERLGFAFDNIPNGIYDLTFMPAEVFINNAATTTNNKPEEYEPFLDIKE